MTQKGPRLTPNTVKIKNLRDKKAPLSIRVEMEGEFLGPRLPICDLPALGFYLPKKSFYAIARRIAYCLLSNPCQQFIIYFLLYHFIVVLFMFVGV